MTSPTITIILDSEDNPYIYEPPPPPEANDANSNSSNSIIDTSNTVFSNSNTIVINTSNSTSNTINITSNISNSNTITVSTNTTNSNTIVIGSNTSSNTANTANTEPEGPPIKYFEFHAKLFKTKQMQVIDTVTKIITNFEEIEKEVTSHYYPKRAVTDEYKTEVYAEMRVLQKAVRKIIKKDFDRLAEIAKQNKDSDEDVPIDTLDKLETIIIYYPEAYLPKAQYQNFITRLQSFNSIKEFIIATRDEDLFNTEPQTP